MYPTSLADRTQALAAQLPVNKLLASLPTEDLTRITRQLTVVPLKYRQVLHKQDSVIDQVFFPGRGACSLTKMMHDGQVAEIATIGSEGVIGASVFFGDTRSFSQTIVHEADGEGFSMQIEPFITEMARRGTFYNRIIRYSQALASQVMQTTVCNGLHSVEQRCCRWLLMTHDRVQGDSLQLTQEFLASMLGVRRPTITLIMAALQKAGLVAQGRGMIHITDRPGLEVASCECYRTITATFRRLLPELSVA